jgi:iron complex transport system substrate-binding protein
MSILKYTLHSFICLLVLTLTGCNGKRKINRDITPGIESKQDYAELFSVIDKKEYKVLSVLNPWQGADNIRLCYYLVKRGGKMPEGLDSSDVIFIPVHKIVCTSTTHLAMISALGEENTIVGVSGKNYIYSSSIRRKIADDLIKDVGFDNNMNKEMILGLDPDIVMMYGVGGESAGYAGKLKELGIKTVFDGDYLENNPLARAEWIKFFGALYCRDKLADSIFRSEVKAYNELKQHINKNIKHRPSVLLGLPFKDTWYISPGNSYMSRLIHDGGGEYLWKDSMSDIAMPMGIENVFMKAMLADYWLNPGTASSLSDISLVDRRLENLPCYIKDNIFNNNRKITGDGGNDYWESGIVHPHMILKDIASILHPKLFENENLFYYRRID